MYVAVTEWLIDAMPGLLFGCACVVPAALCAAFALAQQAAEHDVPDDIAEVMEVDQ